MDLQDDRFDVTFDAKLVTTAQLLATVRKCGFEPKWIESPTNRTSDSAKQLELTALPKDLRELFASAATNGKPVLLHFSGPG